MYIRRGDRKIHLSNYCSLFTAALCTCTGLTGTRIIRPRVFVDEPREYLHQQQAFNTDVLLFQYFVTVPIDGVDELISDKTQALETRFQLPYFGDRCITFLIVTRRAFGAQGR